jgi:hypothetical protein
VLPVVGHGSPFIGLPDQHLALRVEVIGDAEELGNRHLRGAMKFRFAI